MLINLPGGVSWLGKQGARLHVLLEGGLSCFSQCLSLIRVPSSILHMTSRFWDPGPHLDEH